MTGENGRLCCSHNDGEQLTDDDYAFIHLKS